MGFEKISSRLVYEGPIGDVRLEEYRHADGSIAERQLITHPGAVAVVAHDRGVVYLVRQPREVVGEQALLEVPAGKLDVEGESPLECARRELAEEVAIEAREWEDVKRFYSSPGFTEEEMHVFFATGLHEVDHEPDPEERIEVVRWPLADLDGAIAACRDAKSLVALLLFRQRMDG